MFVKFWRVSVLSAVPVPSQEPWQLGISVELDARRQESLETSCNPQHHDVTPQLTLDTPQPDRLGGLQSRGLAGCGTGGRERFGLGGWHPPHTKEY